MARANWLGNNNISWAVGYTGPLTLATWINIISVDTSSRGFGLLDTNLAARGLVILYSGVVATVNNHWGAIAPAAGPLQDSGVTLSTGTWIHLAVTITSNSGATQIIYRNGGVDGTAGPNSYNALQNGDLIQTFQDTTNGYYDSAIYNIALTAAEINALAKGARPNTIRPLSLKLYYPLYGLSSPEPDFSGIANNTSATGAAFKPDPPVMPFTPRWGRFVGWTPLLPASGLGWIINRRNKLMVPKKRA